MVGPKIDSGFPLFIMHKPKLTFQPTQYLYISAKWEKKSCWFKACSSNIISHQHLSSGRDSKASRGVGKLSSGKQEGFLLALMRGSCPGEAGGGHPKLVGGAYLASSCWILSWKWGQNIISNQVISLNWVLAGLNRLFQKLFFHFLVPRKSNQASCMSGL